MKRLFFVLLLLLTLPASAQFAPPRLPQGPGATVPTVQLTAPSLNPTLPTFTAPTVKPQPTLAPAAPAASVVTPIPAVPATRY